MKIILSQPYFYISVRLTTRLRTYQPRQIVFPYFIFKQEVKNYRKKKLFEQIIYHIARLSKIFYYLRLNEVLMKRFQTPRRIKSASSKHSTYYFILCAKTTKNYYIKISRSHVFASLFKKQNVSRTYQPRQIIFPHFKQKEK